MAKAPFSQDWSFEGLVEWATHPVKKVTLSEYQRMLSPITVEPETTQIPPEELALVNLISKCSYIWGTEPAGKDPFKVIGNRYIQKYIRSSLNQNFQTQTLETIRRYTCEPRPFEDLEELTFEFDQYLPLKPFSKDDPTPQYASAFENKDSKVLSPSSSFYDPPAVDKYDAEYYQQNHQSNYYNNNPPPPGLMHRGFNPDIAFASAPVFEPLLRNTSQVFIKQQEEQEENNNLQNDSESHPSSSNLVHNNNSNEKCCWDHSQISNQVQCAPLQEIQPVNVPSESDFGYEYHQQDHQQFIPDYFGWFQDYSSELLFSDVPGNPFVTPQTPPVYDVTLQRAEAGLRQFRQDSIILENKERGDSAIIPQPAIRRSTCQPRPRAEDFPKLTSKIDKKYPLKLFNKDDYDDSFPPLLGFENKDSKILSPSASFYEPPANVKPLISMVLRKPKVQCSSPSSLVNVSANRLVEERRDSVASLDLNENIGSSLVNINATTSAKLTTCTTEDVHDDDPAPTPTGSQGKLINNINKNKSKTVLKLTRSKNTSSSKPKDNNNKKKEKKPLLSMILRKNPKVQTSSLLTQANVEDFVEEWRDSLDQMVHLDDDGTIGIRPIVDLL